MPVQANVERSYLRVFHPHRFFVIEHNFAQLLAKSVGVVALATIALSSLTDVVLTLSGH